MFICFYRYLSSAVVFFSRLSFCNFKESTAENCSEEASRFERQNVKSIKKFIGLRSGYELLKVCWEKKTFYIGKKIRAIEMCNMLDTKINKKLNVNYLVWLEIIPKL